MHWWQIRLAHSLRLYENKSWQWDSFVAMGFTPQIQMAVLRHITPCLNPHLFVSLLEKRKKNPLFFQTTASMFVWLCKAYLFVLTVMSIIHLENLENLIFYHLNLKNWNKVIVWNKTIFISISIKALANYNICWWLCLEWFCWSIIILARLRPDPHEFFNMSSSQRQREKGKCTVC